MGLRPMLVWGAPLALAYRRPIIQQRASMVVRSGKVMMRVGWGNGYFPTLRDKAAKDGAPVRGCLGKICNDNGYSKGGGGRREWR